jgi:hypothetical protein
MSLLIAPNKKKNSYAMKDNLNTKLTKRKVLNVKLNLNFLPIND